MSTSIEKALMLEQEEQEVISLLNNIPRPNALSTPSSIYSLTQEEIVARYRSLEEKDWSGLSFEESCYVFSMLEQDAHEMIAPKLNKIKPIKETVGTIFEYSLYALPVSLTSLIPVGGFFFFSKESFSEHPFFMFVFLFILTNVATVSVSGLLNWWTHTKIKKIFSKHFDLIQSWEKCSISHYVELNDEQMEKFHESFDPKTETVTPWYHPSSPFLFLDRKITQWKARPIDMFIDVKKNPDQDKKLKEYETLDSYRFGAWFARHWGGDYSYLIKLDHMIQDSALSNSSKSYLRSVLNHHMRKYYTQNSDQQNLPSLSPLSPEQALHNQQQEKNAVFTKVVSALVKIKKELDEEREKVQLSERMKASPEDEIIRLLEKKEEHTIIHAPTKKINPLKTC